jgi:hypothetical protein
MLQVLGCYGYRGLWEGNQAFSSSIPPALAIVKSLLPFDDYPYLSELLGKLCTTDFSTPPAAPLEMTKRDSFAPLGMTKGLSSRPSEGTLSFRPSEARGEICHNEPFLVHNVDIVSNLDLNWLREQHREGALATLVVSDRKTQRYFLFDEDNRLKGWTNIATGEVRSPFPDIDPDRCRKLAFAGIHLISPAIFDAFDKYGFGDRFSIVDFYLRACADYPIYAAVPPDFTLVDVGKFDALPEAEATCATILND